MGHRQGVGRASSFLAPKEGVLPLPASRGCFYSSACARLPSSEPAVARLSWDTIFGSGPSTSSFPFKNLCGYPEPAWIIQGSI